MLSILLVRFSSIGDVVLTTPLVRALRRRHPEAELTFVTKRAFVPLVSDNPHLTRVVALEPDEPVRALAHRLQPLAPTHGLDLHGSLRSRALRFLLPGQWSGYRKRKLARGWLISTKLDWYGTHVPVPERYFEAARHLDVRPDGAAPEFAIGPKPLADVDEWIRTEGLDRQALAVLAPGAAHATKRWPTAHWAALAARLTARGVTPVIVGGAADRGLASQIDGVRSVAGTFSLQETGALLARARVVVSGDTGVMHMATGVGAPVIALFGPTVRQFGFQPYGGRAAVLERSLDCRPCSAMGSNRCPMGHHRCLDDIAPAEVDHAAQQLAG
ncbi:MAG TPA: glycosyltransferase family 9 protein [Gemmatimonadales bacterium]|nr:glycosyltransferase family 9 protein [Gemmatimonadales bacterium]